MSPAAEDNVLPVEASVSARIDELCDAFEAAWRRGDSPRLEDYLAGAPPTAIARAFRELVQLEVAYRRRAGEAIVPDAYFARFPGLATAVDDIFTGTIIESPRDDRTLSARIGAGQTQQLSPPEHAPPREGGAPQAASPQSPPPVGPVAPAPLPPVQRFEPIRTHARGGLGEVLVAQDRELHREVALKRIQLDYADDPECRARFVLEAEITGRLEHPGVVPVYGLDRYANGRPFYAMRFIRGQSLKEAIEHYHSLRPGVASPAERNVQLRRLLGRFIDVCDALEYAHSRGIIHRDLKPANVMLGDYGETLVVDWGLAKVMGKPDLASTLGVRLKPKALNDSTPTQMGVVIGTPQFMSPEQAAGRSELVGPASDVYGLGATLYCVLTGRPPLSNPSNSVEEILRQVESGNFRSPRQVNSTIPKPLDAICRKAMALAPQDRYPSARALADDLEAWLADEPIAAAPDTASQRTARWLRRHRAWTLASAIALVLVSVVSIVAAIFVNAEREKAEGLAKSNARLVEQEQRATKQTDTAFREARSAVDELFTRISEDTLLNQPGMQGLRKDLLVKALDYYKRFLDERSDDKTTNEDLGLALFRVGRITDEFESPELAVPYFRKAQLIQERLLADSPRDPKRIAALGDTWNGLGRALQSGQQFNAARDAYQKARELRQQVVDLKPQDNEAKRLLANAIMNAGTLEKDVGQLDEAARDLRAAQRIRESVLTAGGEFPPLERDQARGLYNQALLEIEMKRPEDAAGHLDEAIKRFEALAKRDRRDLNSQYLGAVAERKMGDLKRATHESAESARHFGLARDAFARLADRNPDVAEYQTALAETYLTMADDQKPEEAREAYGKAEAVLRGLAENYPENPKFRRDLAVTLRALAIQQHKAGQVAAAQKNLQTAIDYLTTLTARFPQNKNFAAEREETQKAWKQLFEMGAAEKQF